jgi:hypothetical protein
MEMELGGIRLRRPSKSLRRIDVAGPQMQSLNHAEKCHFDTKSLRELLKYSQGLWQGVRVGRVAGDPPGLPASFPQEEQS